MDVVYEVYDDLNDEYFKKLKELTGKIIKFRVLKDEQITKEIYLEKIYDYLYVVDFKNNINTSKNEYLSVYVNALMGLIDSKKIVKGSRSEKYYKKAKSILDTIKSSEKIEDDLKDFTRIFTSLFIAGLHNKEITNMDFILSYDHLLETIEEIKKMKKLKILRGKEESLVDLKDRYSKMTYVLFFYQLIYLSALSAIAEE